MDIDSIRFIASQQQDIDSLREDIKGLFMLASGGSDKMLYSDNEFVNYIADFIMDAKENGHVKDDRRDTRIEGGNG